MEKTDILCHVEGSPEAPRAIADTEPLAKLHRSSSQRENAVGALYEPQEEGNQRLLPYGFLINRHQKTFTHNLSACSFVLAMVMQRKVADEGQLKWFVLSLEVVQQTKST